MSVFSGKPDNRIEEILIERNPQEGCLMSVKEVTKSSTSIHSPFSNKTLSSETFEDINTKYTWKEIVPKSGVYEIWLKSNTQKTIYHSESRELGFSMSHEQGSNSDKGVIYDPENTILSECRFTPEKQDSECSSSHISYGCILSEKNRSKVNNVLGKYVTKW